MLFRSHPSFGLVVVFAILFAGSVYLFENMDILTGQLYATRVIMTSLFAVTLGFLLSVWWTSTVKYDDKQEDIVKPGEDGQATLTIVQNASSATMDGLEMDFTWVITEGLSLRGNVGLLDASYDDFLASSATGTVHGATGGRGARAVPIASSSGSCIVSPGGSSTRRRSTPSRSPNASRGTVSSRRD